MAIRKQVAGQLVRAALKGQLLRVVQLPGPGPPADAAHVRACGGKDWVRSALTSSSEDDSAADNGDAREWTATRPGSGLTGGRHSEEMSSSFPHFLVISSLVSRLHSSSRCGSVRRQQRAASSNSRRSLQLSLF